MSYVLINGKRYYKDDRTGRTILDNASQAEAERRSRRNQGMARISEMRHPFTAAGNGSSRTAVNPTNITSTARAMVHTGFPWKAVIACAVIVLFVGAFFYNRSHISSGERAITNYMNAQQEQAVSDTMSTAYLMPDSAERYLEASDIENYSHDEIQLIINEIYARHGREFQVQENIDYFNAQDWYDPVSGKTDEEIVSEFNEFEKANMELLCEYR